jgi:hypothetical protein
MIEYTVKVDKGNTYWYLNGEQHRTDGPAVEFACGTKSWWLNGKQHRTDGPAIEYTDGTKAWYLNGKRHRTDGPAIEYTDGNKSWYINGVEVTQAVMNHIKQLTVAQVEALLGYAVKIVAG